MLKWNLWDERQNVLECTERKLKMKPKSDKIPKYKTNWIQRVVRMQGNGFLMQLKKIQKTWTKNGERCAKRLLPQLNQAGSVSGLTLWLLDVDDDFEDWLIMMIN
jgi:hypothetical protein